MDSKSVFSEVNGKNLESPPAISRSAITNFGGRRKKKKNKNKQKRKQTNERQILQKKPP